MAKGFGMVALALAAVAIFLPLGFGLIFTLMALAFATVAAFLGDRVYATATPLVGALNTFLFSPLTLAAILDKVPFMVGVTVAFLIAPFVAMVFSIGRVAAFRKKVS